MAQNSQQPKNVFGQSANEGNNVRSLFAAQDGFNVPPLNKEEGTALGWFDRQDLGWRDGLAFDMADWEARDMFDMMRRDYKARQLEQVLALPITSAKWKITEDVNDNGEQKWLSDFWSTDEFNGGCKDSLQDIISQMTTAITYKHAFFELVYTRPTAGEFAGDVVLDRVAFRPQTTCRTIRDPKNGSVLGFEQEPYYVGPNITQNTYPIQIPNSRAFIYTHGQRMDPVNGTSDLEIAYWCYKTKQKIMFLWFQFLEGVSLPRVIVKAQEQSVADQIAGNLAKMKNSGVLPVGESNPAAVSFDVLDMTGSGSEQFKAAIAWLDNAATDSVQAGFTNLAGTAANGGTAGGSYALSKDASDFFLQMEEGKAREIESAIRTELFEPMVRWKFGPNAAVPHLKFDPLQDMNRSTSVELLTTFLGPRDPALIPDEFIAELSQQVADYVGLNGEKVYEDFVKTAEQVKAQAAQQAQAMAGQTGQQVAGVAGAVAAANQAMQKASDGTTGKGALAAANQAAQGVPPKPAKPTPAPKPTTPPATPAKPSSGKANS